MIRKKRFFDMDTLVIKILFILCDIFVYWLVVKVMFDPIVNYIHAQNTLKIKSLLTLFTILTSISIFLKLLDFFEAIYLLT